MGSFQLNAMRHPALLLLVVLTILKYSQSAQAEFSDAGHILDPQQQAVQLIQIAHRLVAPGKGILAADESTGTLVRRLQQVGVSNTAAKRAAWRQLLLTSPGLSQYINGVILTEDTLYQELDLNDPQQCSNSRNESSSSSSSSSSVGGTYDSSSLASPRRLADVLLDQGIAVGVKVDQGLVPLNPDAAGSTEPQCEVQTQGLEGLEERCRQYAANGASFVKWRAVLRVDKTLGWPSDAAVAVNAAQLAQFAAAAQAAGLVPLVEPEVMVMEGDHGIEVSEAASTRVLAAVVKALLEHSVLLEGIVLKPAMVLPGSPSSSSSSSTGSATSHSSGDDIVEGVARSVAAATLRVLRRTVPPAVPGVAFLSGGQTEQQAARHLAAINAACCDIEGASMVGSSAAADSPVCCSSSSSAGRCCRCPWSLTFSFGRALQASALQVWADAPQNTAAIQQVFIKTAAAAAAAAAVEGCDVSTQQLT